MLHDLTDARAALILEIILMLLPLVIWATATLDGSLERYLLKHPPRSAWLRWRVAVARDRMRVR